MLKMPLKINGVDFSSLTERLGYSVTYEERIGGNTMLMQNGDRYEDLITRRPVLTWPLNALTGTELAQLHEAINASVYVPIEYQDTATNSVQTWWFKCSIGQQEVGVIRNGGYYRYRQTTLTAKPR